MDDFAIEDSFEEYTSPPIYQHKDQDIQMQMFNNGQSYPPLDDDPSVFFSASVYASNNTRSRSLTLDRLLTISENPDQPINDEAAAAAPAPRKRRRQTTSSSRPHATSSSDAQRKWYGPGHNMDNTSSGYGPTTAFPAMQLDQPSPPDSKADVKPKAVKHKRGYQACDQCRQRKTGCQLGGTGNCSEVHISMLTLCRRRRQSECSTVQSVPSRRESMHLRPNKKEENLIYWLVPSGRSTTTEQFRLTRRSPVISIPSRHWPESILGKQQPSSCLHWPGSISHFTPDLTSL
jgi:hypothetical protein